MTSATAHPPGGAAPPARPADDPLAADTVVLAALSSTIALLHISAAVGHVAESTLYALLFVLLAAFQLAWAIAIAFTPHRTGLLRAGMAINVAVIVIWACSRTTGLPVGPDLRGPEAIGLPDLTATLDELVLISISAMMLRRRQPLPERAVGASCLLIVCSLLVFVVLAHVS